MAVVLSCRLLAATRLPGQPVPSSAPAAFPSQSSLVIRSLCDSPAQYTVGPVRISCLPRSVHKGRKTGTAILAARDESQGQSSPSSTTPPSDEASVPGTSAKSHLDMLQLYTRQSNQAATISEQLARVYESESSDDEAEVSIPLSSTEKVEPPSLTIHQKRNIRRQDYLNQVAKRNDAPFFAAIALSILLPPACILAVAIATGYVDIFP